MSTAVEPPENAEGPAEKPTQDLSLRASLQVLFRASRAFWLVNLVNFGDGIAYFGILTLLTRFLGTRLDMSDGLSGFTVSMFTGLVTLFMLGGGFVSDRLGVRRALTWSLGIVGIGRLLLTISPAVSGTEMAQRMASLFPGTEAPQVVAWLGLILMAAGTGVMQPALYAGVKEYTDERTATIGYSLLYAIMNLGIVAENFISPWVRTDEVFVDRGGLRIVGLGWGIDGVFWVCVWITGLLLLVHLLLFTRAVEAREHVAPEAPAESDTRSWVERAKEMPFLDVRFMYFIFILLPVRTLFAHQFLTMPDYIFRCFPVEVNSRYEWISALNPLIIVIFVPTIAAATRRVRVIDMMIYGTLVTALSTFLLAPGPNLTLLLSYVVLFSLGEALWSSRFLEYVADLAPPGKVGAYMGLANIPWFFAKFTTGLYSGVMLAWFVPEQGPQSPGTLWLIYACMACVSPVGLLLARRWILQGEHHAQG